MPLKTEPTGRHNRFAISYRIPLPVTRIRLYENGDRYPICPRCHSCLDREYVAFCSNCGQRTNWTAYPLALPEKAPPSP